MAKKVWQNQTRVFEFTLLGFGDLPKLQVLLFLPFLVIYVVTMAGNLLIVVLVVTDRHLHTPMYIFLGNLSFLECCYSSTILPKMLSSILAGGESISIKACFLQFFIFASLAGTECYLLAMMSYDRYLAICKPLNYVVLMNGRVSFQLSVVSWVSGFFASTILTSSVSWLSFCGPNEIDDYFCDVSSNVRYISCSDTTFFELSAFVFACVFTLPPFLLTVSSYGFIIATILRIPSTTGRQKAFSTCSSHLAVVALYYGSLMLVYMLPRSKALIHMKKVFSLFYTVLTPMINPLIYSLRNTEVKEAMKKGFRGFIFYITP
ncbi:olfactory receptor 10A3-like [Zootoca vivipara]|uniref:olfactory receptor 10A3-like n=1 Tax=Zootoca vivipara TaxID=8524 RepID=UPI00293BD268|nr:olfactory receptor 10A3-like [Zootoca vivipara]